MISRHQSFTVSLHWYKTASYLLFLTFLTFLKSSLFLTDLQDEDLHSESRDDASDSVPAAERPNALPSDDDITSGEFVLRTLFAEFTIVAEQKIELVLTEPLVSNKIISQMVEKW